MRTVRLLAGGIFLAGAAALAAAAARPSPSALAGEGAASAAGLDAELRAKAKAALQDGRMRQLQAEVQALARARLAEPGVWPKSAAELETIERHMIFAAAFDFQLDAANVEFLTWFLDQPEFCLRLCHALEGSDSRPGALAVLQRLRAVKGPDEKRFLAYREMAIAMALVWDRYEWLPWTGIKAPDGRLEEIWNYYLESAPRLVHDPARLPHELLVHVVDHPLTAEEREYALGGFRGRANLGAVFFDIRWTNTAESLAQGRNKSIPYTLMNIKKVNGVCMEQAYYASCIAKCLGVPAAYCRGLGARGGHAWVGVLTAAGGVARWDFNSGRYSYDHYWNGTVYDPTSRRGNLSDGEVAMTAGILTLPRQALDSADARRNLALFVLAAAGAPLGAAGPGTPAAGDLGQLPADRRKLVCDLLLSSVQLNPFSRRTWHVVAAAAERGGFSLDEIQSFSDILFRTVDTCAPDFACATVLHLVRAVKDPAAAARLYDTCFNYFRKRPDLAAAVKVAQGRRAEAAGDGQQALAAFLAAVASFPRDGHVTQAAAASIDRLLAKGEPAKAVETLIAVWKSMEAGLQGTKPEEREAMRIVGENLVKYMKLARMDKDLAVFEPAFRRMFPAAVK